MAGATLLEHMQRQGFVDAFLQHRLLHPSLGMDLEYETDYLMGGSFARDLQRIESRDYYFDLPLKKMIPKSLSDRKRTVFCFGGTQKIMLQAMSFALHAYDQRFPDCVYSSILGKSFKEYVFRLRYDPTFSRMYAVKVDIKSYGASIDIDILVQKLRVFFEDDPVAFDFLRWLLERRTYCFEGRREEGDTSALPGIPVHSFFTNLYLLDMDQKVDPVSTAYCRYSDDILAFADGAAEAQELMALLRAETEGVKLRFNEKKTRIYPPHTRFDHMGICYEDGRIDLSDYSIYKLKRKQRIRTKRIRRQVEDGVISPVDGARRLVRLTDQTFFGRNNSRELCWSRWLFPMLTEHEGLHQLDLYNQRCLRYILTGKWSDAAYRVRYRDLKDLGYVSLVRKFYE